MSYLEQWIRDHKLQDSGAMAALEPCIQASQLLQARKTDSDVDSICEMCSRLTTSQVSVTAIVYCHRSVLGVVRNCHHFHKSTLGGGGQWRLYAFQNVDYEYDALHFHTGSLESTF